MFFLNRAVATSSQILPSVIQQKPTKHDVARRRWSYPGWASAAGCNEDEWMRPESAGARPGVVLALEKQAPLGFAAGDK